MKILLIPPNDLLRHPIPNRMFHIAKRLAERHDIYLLSYTKHPLAEGVRRRIKALEVRIDNALTTKNLGFYYVLNAPQTYITIKHVVENEDIDGIVHANILPSLIASKLAKSLGKPNVYDFLDYFPESAAAYYVQGKQLVELGVKLLVLQALEKSDAVVTPSYGLKRIVEELVPGKPICVIPNGVDSKLFKPYDQALARKAIGLDTGYYLALLQGSLDVWIDIVEVIKIIKRIREEIDLRLLVVGFSHAKHYYRVLMKCTESYGIGKYVYTYPTQPYERMPIFINSCDLVLAPVKKMLMNFATPLKIAEALACGVPVVTTNISEFKLWYRRGIYTYTTQAELEDLVKLLLNKIDEIRAELRDYSNNFREAFDWDRLAKEYEKLLNAIVQKH